MLGNLSRLLCHGLSVCSLLFFDRAPFWDFGEVLAFKDGFVYVEAAVARTIFSNIGVSIVTRADDIAVEF